MKKRIKENLGFRESFKSPSNQMPFYFKALKSTKNSNHIPMFSQKPQSFGNQIKKHKKSYSNNFVVNS